jgi:hypothetical protein
LARSDDAVEVYMRLNLRIGLLGVATLVFGLSASRGQEPDSDQRSKIGIVRMDLLFQAYVRRTEALRILEEERVRIDSQEAESDRPPPESCLHSLGARLTKQLLSELDEGLNEYFRGYRYDVIVKRGKILPICSQKPACTTCKPIDYSHGAILREGVGKDLTEALLHGLNNPAQGGLRRTRRPLPRTP